MKVCVASIQSESFARIYTPRTMGRIPWPPSKEILSLGLTASLGLEIDKAFQTPPDDPEKEATRFVESVGVGEVLTFDTPHAFARFFELSAEDFPPADPPPDSLVEDPEKTWALVGMFLPWAKEVFVGLACRPEEAVTFFGIPDFREKFSLTEPKSPLALAAKGDLIQATGLPLEVWDMRAK
ncbi:MAG: hypothetical protein D6812_07200 [Deltaproteobacteria bacterium]|nr:MAG: hypothetical protein D6812_07200 [Deltaproteobacteria bacterium]